MEDRHAYRLEAQLTRGGENKGWESDAGVTELREAGREQQSHTVAYCGVLSAVLLGWRCAVDCWEGHRRLRVQVCGRGR